MQIINGYKVDETKKFRLTKGKSEKIFDNYAEAIAFMQKNYGYILTYSYMADSE